VVDMAFDGKCYRELSVISSYRDREILCLSSWSGNGRCQVMGFNMKHRLVLTLI